MLNCTLYKLNVRHRDGNGREQRVLAFYAVADRLPTYAQWREHLYAKMPTSDSLRVGVLAALDSIMRAGFNSPQVTGNSAYLDAGGGDGSTAQFSIEKVEALMTKPQDATEILANTPLQERLKCFGNFCNVCGGFLGTDRPADANNRCEVHQDPNGSDVVAGLKVIKDHLEYCAATHKDPDVSPQMAKNTFGRLFGSNSN